MLNFQVFGDFPVTAQLLFSGLGSFWSQNVLYMISFLFKFVKVLWPRISVLVDILCALEKNVYPVVWGWTSSLSLYVSWIHVIDSIIQYFSILADVPPNISVDY